MSGYSIFNHEQFHNGGVCQPLDDPTIVGEKPNEQTIHDCGEAGHDTGKCGNASCVVTNEKKRVRSPRGWAVAAGLGLGPQFNDKKVK